MGKFLNMKKRKKGDIIMLTYRFMRIAFLVAILLGITIPLLGSQAVYKRLSSSGDALAHSSLAGVAIALVANLNPLWISMISCVLSFFIIEILRKKFNKYAEMGVAVVLSSSVGLAGILSGFASSANFDSYLFGSILLISNTELYLTIGLTIVAIVFSLLFYPQIFLTLYSENEARVSKVKVNLLVFIQDFLLAITIAIGSKVVGSLVVSSLVVLPTAISLQLKKGYKMTMIFSLVFSIVSMIVGLIISYYLDFRPGATIVSLLVIILLIVMIFREIVSFIKKKTHLIKAR